MTRRTRVVVAVPSSEIERLDYEPSGQDLLLDRRVELIPIDGDGESPTAATLAQLGLLDEPGVLVESPYERDVFERVETAAGEFAHQKLFLFSQFCGLLGAKKVTALRVLEETEQGRREFDLGLKPVGALGAKAEGESTSFDRLASRFRLEDEYEGGEFDVAAAQQLLQKHRLLRDANMRGLLGARESANPIRSREVVLNVMQETSGALRVAASLAVPAYLSLDASYKSELNSTRQLTVVLRIEF